MAAEDRTPQNDVLHDLHIACHFFNLLLDECVKFLVCAWGVVGVAVVGVVVGVVVAVGGALDHQWCSPRIDSKQEKSPEATTALAIDLDFTILVSLANEGLVLVR